MTTMTNDVLKQIVGELDCSSLPLHFITAISVVDEHGFEDLYTGDDIEKVMKAEIKVKENAESMFLLDTRALYNAVQVEYFYIFETVFEKIKKYEAEKDIDKE